MSKRKRKRDKNDEPAQEVIEPTDDNSADSDDMSEEVAEVRAIELSEEAAELLGRVEAERDEAIAGRQRALADYRNYQRRAIENEARATQDGITRVVRSLLPVMDHFDLALCQDREQLTVEQLVCGVQMVREELAKALQAHDVETIAPEVGDEFDPNLHQAMMKQPAEGIAANHVVMVMQVGYKLGDLVLRPAKVAVAPADEEEE